MGGCPLLHGYRAPARSKPHRTRSALARAAAPGRALARSSRIRDRVAPSPPLERTSRPALASDRLQPRFHGPGAGRLSPPGTSRRDSSRRELRPNPIGSDTSCRELVAPRLEGRRHQEAGGRAGKHASPVRLRAHLASPLSRCPPRSPGDPLTRGRRARENRSRSLPLARMVLACADTTRGQGPPHPILREEDRDPLHPRCLSSMGCPVRGRTFSTACLQPVENLRRLFDPRPPLPSLTGR